MPLIGFGAGVGTVTNKDWQLEVKTNTTSSGLMLRVSKLEQPGQVIEYNFTLGFYPTFIQGNTNPLTMETELCSSGHYAFCSSLKEPLEYGLFQNISVIEGNVV